MISVFTWALTLLLLLSLLQFVLDMDELGLHFPDLLLDVLYRNAMFFDMGSLSIPLHLALESENSIQNTVASPHHDQHNHDDVQRVGLQNKNQRFYQTLQSIGYKGEYDTFVM